LLPIELRVQTASFQQIIMCSPLHDPAPVHDQNHIRRQDRAEPVRDCERGLVSHQRVECCLNQPFCPCVQRARGLVAVTGRRSDSGSGAVRISRPPLPPALCI
jgi:hypothetical protein